MDIDAVGRAVHAHGSILGGKELSAERIEGQGSGESEGQDDGPVDV